MSVVRKKFIGQLQLYGNLPYKCSIHKKRQIQLVVRDRMNSLCPMNFFRTTDTTDTTDTTIWKPGLRSPQHRKLRFYSPHHCIIKDTANPHVPLLHKIQSNPAISNSVISNSPQFRTHRSSLTLFRTCRKQSTYIRAQLEMFYIFELV